MTLTTTATGVWRSRTHSVDTAGVTNGCTWSTVMPVSSVAWGTANLALYVPVRVRNAGVVKQLIAGNGTTATGNIDVGLYDAAGTRLQSAYISNGSSDVAQSGTSNEQVFDITDITIGPGLYYLAVALSSATATLWCYNTAAAHLASFGVLSEASAYPLPATATWAVNQTFTPYPTLSMTFNTVIT